MKIAALDLGGNPFPLVILEGRDGRPDGRRTPVPTKRSRSLPRAAGQPEAAPAPVEPLRPVAVLDMGASAIRLVVAEIKPGEPMRILEEASRGVLLGKDTFTSGRLGAATVEATLKALEGFRRIMDGYGAVRYR